MIRTATLQRCNAARPLALSFLEMTGTKMSGTYPLSYPFGRPWIFKEIRDYLDGHTDATIDVNTKLDILEEQLRINIERIDEKRGILHTRRHLAATPIFKGIPDFRQTRIALLRAERYDELMAILEQIRSERFGATDTIDDDHQEADER